MPRTIRFRFGRLDYSGLPAYQSRDITIEDDVLDFALGGARMMIMPASYTAQPPGVQTVELTSIVLDFNARLVDYDKSRLMSIIRALKSGTPLPPLSVEARQGGLYKLENGYHRFLACALLGFSSIPIDQPPASASVPSPIAKSVAPWRPKGFSKDVK